MRASYARAKDLRPADRSDAATRPKARARWDRACPTDRCGKSATFAHMGTVASRDLRNHTADVLRQVADGAIVTITVNGMPVAEVSPVRATRKRYLAKADLLDLLSRHQADPAMAPELDRLAGENTIGAVERS